MQDEQKLTNLLKETSIELKPSPNGQLVFLDNVAVTEEIRSKEVTASVSAVSAHATLREEMVTDKWKWVKTEVSSWMVEILVRMY